MVRNIFHNKVIVSYLHPTVKHRSTLYLVKNDFCQFNEVVGTIKIITATETQAVKNKNYIKITSIKTFKEEKIVELVYPIEGASFKINLNKDNVITAVEVVEK